MAAEKQAQKAQHQQSDDEHAEEDEEDEEEEYSEYSESEGEESDGRGPAGLVGEDTPSESSHSPHHHHHHHHSHRRAPTHRPHPNADAKLLTELRLSRGLQRLRTNNDVRYLQEMLKVREKLLGKMEKQLVEVSAPIGCRLRVYMRF